LSLAEATSSAYFAVDSQFMALPAFAMLARLDNDSRYLGRLHELFRHNKVTLGLYDDTSHLYFRDASYLYPARQTPNGRKVFWSRGNGWAFAALARILAELPVNDPAHFPGPESSGTALFTYGIARGIREGLLRKSTYGSVVAKAWKGMVKFAVHTDGKLGYVQDIGQQPVPADRVTYESTANFGVGAFLLAGSEVAELAVDGDKYEVEDLAATVSSGDGRQVVGDAWASGAQYSRGEFNAIGDYIEYSAWVPEPGT
jgi:rhamnogalacturonyl hydrolase YesR